MAGNGSRDKDRIAELQSQVDNTLGLTAGDSANLAYALFRLLDAADEEDRPVLLRYITERWDLRSSSGEVRLPQLINSNELDDLKQSYGPIVDSSLKMMAAANPPADEFYDQLYELIHNPIFKDEKTQAFALYWLLIDNRIPYFQLEQGLRLSDDDWRRLSEKVQPEKAKLNFILAIDFEQRSEEADLILRELDRLQGPERVRLMGFLMWVLRDMDRQLRSASDILK
jgi:hypothetical protein